MLKVVSIVQLGWIDFSKTERSKILSVLDLLQEKGTLRLFVTDFPISSSPAPLPSRPEQSIS